MIEIDIAKKLGDFSLAAKFQLPLGITAIFGPSGAGKTTIIRMISGLGRPDCGRISIDGNLVFDDDQGINLSSRLRRVGYVGQSAELFNHLGVRANITYSQWAGGRKGSIKLEEVLIILGIEHLLGRKVAKLSGGERQRVAIARALMSDPKLLLLDEPLSALDELRKQEILPFLEAIAREVKIPILYISHSVDEVVRLADNLVVLENGRVTNNGPIGEVLSEIDLRGTGTREAGSILEGICKGSEEDEGLARVEVDGQEILLGGCEAEDGLSVRLHVRASDVAIALERPRAISIQNILSCEIVSIREEGEFHVVLVLELDKQHLRARITKKSVRDLNLAQGTQCFALLKAVALEGLQVYQAE